MKNEIYIFSYKIARELIKKNFRVIDIRPNKKIKNGTLFVFDATENLKQYIKKQYNINIDPTSKIYKKL